MKQILIHSWFPPMVRGTNEAQTSLDVWYINDTKIFDKMLMIDS